MGNILIDSIKYVDSKSLDFSVKLLGKWNKITGKRKKDLSDVLLYTSPIIEGGLIAALENPALGALYGGMKFLAAYQVSDIYDRVLKTEEGYTKRGRIPSPNSDVYMANMLLSGFFGIGVGVIFTANLVDPSIGYFGLGLGQLMCFFSSQIIRVPDQKVGQSVFSKAKEKLVDKLKEIRIPTPVPVPKN